jgi:hypothetical protein
VQVMVLRAYKRLKAGLRTIGKMECSYEKSCVDFHEDMMTWRMPCSYSLYDVYGLHW